MRKDFGSKSWMFPLPVLMVAAYDKQGRPNVMNAAWGGIYTDETIGICLSAGHKTTQNILETGAFTVGFATRDRLEACDYAGIVSGNDEPDKFFKAGFHELRAGHVNAPLIEELPLSLECELIAYDPQSCYMTGKIVNVSADESALDEKGHIDTSRLGLLIFDPANNDYLLIGEKAGKAFSAGLKLK